MRIDPSVSGVPPERVIRKCKFEGQEEVVLCEFALIGIAVPRSNTIKAKETRILTFILNATLFIADISFQSK